jgi:hypothetical protein
MKHVPVHAESQHSERDWIKKFLKIKHGWWQRKQEGVSAPCEEDSEGGDIEPYFQMRGMKWAEMPAAANSERM